MFTLHFEVKNPNMLLRKLIDLKLYNLMYELNKDVLERVETLHEDDDGSLNVLLVFKRFGSELGIAQNICSYIQHVKKIRIQVIFV